MSETEPTPSEERRHRNLVAVARHLGRSQDAPAPDARAHRSRLGRVLLRLGPLGVLLVLVLGKAKVLVPLFKVLKLGTLLTMLIAVWAYAQIWGAAFATGFVLLIFVHEMGHALVMKHQKIPAGAPVFIPFVGAVIAMKGRPRDAWVEALVGIGGPVLGSAGALGCLVVAWLTSSAFWYALASTGFLINLFNLMPISPLDGGRIVGVVSRWIWVLGFAMCVAVFLATYHPMLLLILALGLLSLRRTVRGADPSYYDVAPRKRLAMGAAYFALAALLTVGMHAADRALETLRP